jgi:hypothetical protein
MTLLRVGVSASLVRPDPGHSLLVLFIEIPHRFLHFVWSGGVVMACGVQGSSFKGCLYRRPNLVLWSGSSTKFVIFGTSIL